MTPQYHQDEQRLMRVINAYEKDNPPPSKWDSDIPTEKDVFASALTADIGDNRSLYPHHRLLRAYFQGCGCMGPGLVALSCVVLSIFWVCGMQIRFAEVLSNIIPDGGVTSRVGLK